MKPLKLAPATTTSFTLPYVILNGMKLVTDERAPITLRFRARLLDGYQGEYAIRIGESSTGLMTIHAAAASTRLTAAAMDVLETGPATEPVIPGEYTDITIRPDHNWLGRDQGFAAFSLGFNGPGNTDNHFPPYTSAGVLIGIQRP